MRIYSDYFNSGGLTDQNSLANALMTRPDVISPVLTHLMGREDQRFPLSFMTEGSNNVKLINGTEYEYNVISRMDQAIPLAETISTGTPGIGSQQFQMVFTQNWFPKQYVIAGPSQTQVRIMSDPKPKGSNWEYTVQLVNPDPTAYMPLTDLTAGSLFAHLYAPVGEASKGNESNWMAPSKIRHRISTIRKSYKFTGSVANMAMIMEFSLGGKPMKLWMDFEEYQHMLRWKEECELYYWYGKQSYDEKFSTPLRDENGTPIIIGPGLLEQIQVKDTYTEMTTSKIKQVVRDALYGMTDTGNKHITLYTGTGGADEFDRAMKDELRATNYKVYNPGTFVTGKGRNLSLAGFFTNYEHVDGHTVTVARLPLLDHSAYAKASSKHPKSGLPLESYRMIFVDQSDYDGAPNIQMIAQSTRQQLRWVVPGSTIPNGYTGNAVRANDVDGASVHFLKTAGIVLRRFNTSIDLQCVIS